MTRLTLLAASLAAGSGQKEASAMSKFADQMCACKDSACAVKVSDDMAKWGKEQAASADVVPAMDEATQKQFAELGDAMSKCTQTAMSGSAAPAPAAP